MDVQARQTADTLIGRAARHAALSRYADELHGRVAAAPHDQELVAEALAARAAAEAVRREGDG